MFFTGYSRAADQVLLEQKEQSVKGAVVDDRQPSLRQGARAVASRRHSRQDDVEGSAELMHEHWLHKTKRST